MSIERERAHIQSPSVDPNSPVKQYPAQLMPSEVAPPTRVDTAPQQGLSSAFIWLLKDSRLLSASTQPGDGSEVHTEPREDTVSDDLEQGGQPHVPGFKEKVIGVAKVPLLSLQYHDTLTVFFPPP